MSNPEKEMSKWDLMLVLRTLKGNFSKVPNQVAFRIQYAGYTDFSPVSPTRDWSSTGQSFALELMTKNQTFDITEG